MSYSTPLTRAPLYRPSPIAALVELLAEEGVASDAALQDTGLDAPSLAAVGCLTSVDQHLVVAANAVRRSTDPALPFRLGARLRLSDDGVLGLMLLSSASVHDYFGLAMKYQLLSPSTVIAGTIETDGPALRVVLEETTGDALPEALRTFLVEQHVLQQITRLDDLLGARCRPTLACFAYPAPPHRALYEAFLGCPCRFERPRFELWYPTEVLARRPYLANAAAAEALQSTCDRELAEIETSLGVTGQVYRALRQLPDPGVGMKAVASRLKMTDRTLRRRLADEGTSYSRISHHVRYAVASRELRHSAASIEQIAALTGFSDPANFRRAFIRWASVSPAVYRRQQAG